MKTARQIVVVLLALLAGRMDLFGHPAQPTQPNQPTQPTQIVRVEAVGMTVSDMDRSVDFYTRVLHCTKTSEAELTGPDLEHRKGVFGARVRVARLKLGEEVIELTEYLAAKGRPIPPEAKSNDLSFQHIAIVVSDMPRAFDWLRQNHVLYTSSAPQTLPAWNKQAAGIQAFYFKDPDGHSIEIIHFPAGKGDPRWQTPNPELFEGIDHTAIAVSDTDRSLAFYRDQLGMGIVGESENYGDEQEHLNSVFGARLRITSLRAPHGPGVELLEYLVPRTGQPIPADAQANDISHWETIVEVDNPTSAWRLFREWHSRLLSSDVVRINDTAGAARAGFLLQDPDGHVVALENAAPSR